MHQKMPIKVVAIDFETELLDGTPSTEFYRHDFRIKTCAFTSRNRSIQVVGEPSIRVYLERAVREKWRVVVHNLQFEWGCVRERFPGLETRIQWHADTQRLVQLGDNGAGEGVSLQACARRWLPTSFHNHKALFHELIEQRGGKGGQDLHLLSPEELERYNILDAEVTLELYYALTKYFKEIKYDWQLDWKLYTSACKLSAKSKSKGVYVDRAQVESSRSTIGDAFNQSGARFFEQHAEGIKAVEERLRTKTLEGYKTERGRLNADPSLWKFNIDSNVHLEMLFVDYYGVKPQFFTPTGKPSMSAKFFQQWGVHAEPLMKRGNMEITLNQLAALEENTRYDGRLHIDVRINGTKTGRGASGEE